MTDDEQPAGAAPETCPTCGGPVPPGAQSCPSCGEPLPTRPVTISRGDRLRWLVHRLVVFVVPVVLALPGVVIPERPFRIAMTTGERLFLHVVVAVVVAVIAFGVTFLLIPVVKGRLGRAGKSGFVAAVVYTVTVLAFGAARLLGGPADRHFAPFVDALLRGLGQR